MDDQQLTRLARVLFNKLCPGIRWTEGDIEFYKSAVRVMISEMREPTTIQYDTLSWKGKLWSDTNSYEVWTTYIDALVNE